MGRQERMDRQDETVPMEALGNPDPKVGRVRREPLALTVLKARRGLRETRARRDRRDLPVTEVQRGRP
jgi:hypothetical protein